MTQTSLLATYADVSQGSVIKCQSKGGPCVGSNQETRLATPQAEEQPESPELVLEKDLKPASASVLTGKGQRC